MTTTSKLADLARLYGVQTSYLDMRQQKRDASSDSLIAVLRLLGADVNGLDDVDRTLLARRRELWERLAEPVVVAWDGIIPPLLLRTPAGLTGNLKYSIAIENSGVQTFVTPISKLTLRAGQEVGRTRYVVRELTVGSRVPVGYHRLYLEQGSRRQETLIIAAPGKAYFPFKQPEWGVFAPIYSLHSKRNPNAGNFDDFESLIDWLGAKGGRVTATLPILASFLDHPFEPSPYSPASRLFWNEFYLDGSETPHERMPGLVDYQYEMALRRNSLEREASAFFRNSQAEDRERFAAFVNQEDQLQSYASFRAVTEKYQSGWTSWPARLRNGQIRKGDFDEANARYHLYAQWRLHERLRALSDKTRRNGQLLYLDLPLGLHPDSFDIWRNRDIFVTEAAGGSPPDPVFTRGQNWGFPPMHPDVMRLRHYDYTVAYIRNHLRYARMLRIDHVMGLHRLFWIPHGLTADRGVYVEYPADELYAILCVESHRNQAGIVGENLGTVPPEVNILMQRHNIKQMYVLQYEIVGGDPKRALRTVPENAIASLNTHDMPPFRSFLEGKDIDDRFDLNILDEAGAKQEHRHRAQIRKSLIEFLQSNRLLKKGTRVSADLVFKAAMRFLAGSAANVVLVNLEDLWGETLPQNVPSTQAERPNWRRRMRLGLEEIAESQDAARTLRLIEKGRRQRK
jgi:4-alpha-glucanotransferase